MFLTLIKDALSESNLEAHVDSVSAPKKAIEYVRQEGLFTSKHLPSLVLMDFDIMRANDFEALDAFKAEKKAAGIPIIGLVPIQELKAVAAGYRQNLDHHIAKPKRAFEFAEAVMQIEKYWYDRNQWRLG